MGCAIWKQKRPCRSVGQSPQQSAPQPGMEVEPNEEIVRLRALVAELQKERVQEVEANRTKKARTLAGSCTDLAHRQGGHSAQNPSEVMSTWIDEDRFQSQGGWQRCPVKPRLHWRPRIGSAFQSCRRQVCPCDEFVLVRRLIQHLRSRRVESTRQRDRRVGRRFNPRSSDNHTSFSGSGHAHDAG